MQNEIGARDSATRRIELRQVAFDKVHTADVCEVFTLAGDEIVDHANVLAAAHKLFCQMRADEPGAAGYQIEGHNGAEFSKKTAAVIGLRALMRADRKGSQSSCKPTSVRPHRLATVQA